MAAVPVLALLVAAPAPAQEDAPAAAAGSTRAERALAEARALFSGEAAERRSTAARGLDATFVLRDLRLYRDELSRSDRATADRLLARPAATTRKCTKRICVHWKPSSVSGQDTNDNGISDYIDRVVSTVDDVHRTYVNAGYRAPLSDRGIGGNNKTDIYIKDVGAKGIYGYCETDEGGGLANKARWAYCVLDNDYKPSQFPANTPLENMRVTAAHEYFHAVQFAYDVFEDAWFMEGTATWAEDELFDGINDNVFYLSSSPLSDPQIPLNTFQSTGLYQYGTWIWFRYLTERFTASTGGMPNLVLKMWKKAPSTNSLQAIKQTLDGAGTSLRTQFTAFADGNLRPEDTYEEGAANNYPAAPYVDGASLSEAGPSAEGGFMIDHLTSKSFEFTPNSLTGPWNLEIDLDMAPKDRGSSAIVTVNLLAGGTQTTVIPLNDAGNGTAAVEFSSSFVDSVAVTLVNTSTKNADDDRPADLLVTAVEATG